MQLQVILNKDTPLSVMSSNESFTSHSVFNLIENIFKCEPTLLPEPNHVMLCHLYALSIKDGVMVLSATHRYRKKYVTTLLYKPIWETRTQNTKTGNFENLNFYKL